MLWNRINEDLKEAMKKRDRVTLSVVRMLKTAMTKKTIELEKDKLEDAEVIALVKKDIKRHRDSIEQFEKGGRKDLSEKEKKELVVLESYMPEAPSAEAVKEIVKYVIKETGASGKKDFGAVMKKSMEKLGGSADGKVVSDIVKELLEQSNAQAE